MGRARVGGTAEPMVLNLLEKTMRQKIKYDWMREDGKVFVGNPGETTFHECSVFDVRSGTWMRVNPCHDRAALTYAAADATGRNVIG